MMTGYMRTGEMMSGRCEDPDGNEETCDDGRRVAIPVLYLAS
jgi:hypothetical protein